jgi:hypothetical protein
MSKLKIHKVDPTGLIRETTEISLHSCSDQAFYRYVVEYNGEFYEVNYNGVNLIEKNLTMAKYED